MSQVMGHHVEGYLDRLTLSDTPCRIRAHSFRILLFTSLSLWSRLSLGEYVVLYLVCQTQSALLQAQTHVKSTRREPFCFKLFRTGIKSVRSHICTSDCSVKAAESFSGIEEMTPVILRLRPIQKSRQTRKTKTPASGSTLAWHNVDYVRGSDATVLGIKPRVLCPLAMAKYAKGTGLIIPNVPPD